MSKVFKAHLSLLIANFIYHKRLLVSIVALPFGKDEITLVKIMSAALIIAGVYLVSRPVKQSGIIHKAE